MTVTFLWLRVVYVVQAGRQFSNILWPKTLCGGKKDWRGELDGEKILARRCYNTTRGNNIMYKNNIIILCGGSFEEETKGKIVLPSESLLLCLHFESYRICS